MKKNSLNIDFCVVTPTEIQILENITL